MSEHNQSAEDAPSLIKAGPEEKLGVLDSIRERMKKEELSPLEEFTMQKAIGLFLLSERVNWGLLHSLVVQGGLSELPSLNISDNHTEDEVVQAITSLEQKGLLHFEDNAENNDSIMRIGFIREELSYLVRSVHPFERKTEEGQK